MREILFRGQEKKSGKWVYGGYYKHYKRQPCPVDDYDKEEDAEHLIIKSGFADWNMPRGIEAFEVKPETVGQFTGMNDGKDQKIFEGDIIRDKSEKKNYCVIYAHMDACFYLSEIIDWNPVECRSRPLGRRNNYYIKVVGSIYDNPELLE